MCGRFTLHTQPQEVAHTFGVETSLFQLHYNIAPSANVLVVRHAAAQRVLTVAHWGLVPSWSRAPKAVANARAETVADKPTFRDSFRQRRCLIPANGFYEWQAVNGRKQPFYYRLRGGGLFAFAGLWDRWQGLETCAIITTEANDLVRKVHGRMPVILGADSYELWLDAKVDPKELAAQLRPYPAEAMEGFPIARRVNQAGQEGPGLIEPLAVSSLESD